MTEAQAAARAQALYSSRAFQNVYLRGHLAAKAGRSIGVCPYRRHRRGWAVWRAAWILGYQEHFQSIGRARP